MLSKGWKTCFVRKPSDRKRDMKNLLESKIDEHEWIWRVLGGDEGGEKRDRFIVTL